MVLKYTTVQGIKYEVIWNTSWAVIRRTAERRALKHETECEVFEILQWKLVYSHDGLDYTPAGVEKRNNER